MLTVNCLFILIAGCTAPQSKTDSSAVENVPRTEMEMVPYENPVWIDNFLSADRKDTLRIQIWSETNKQFISEVPNDTTNDWKGLKSFGIALWDNDGTESLRKCLIKKDGRWMYADQSDIDIEAKENPYHYLFD